MNLRRLLSVPGFLYALATWLAAMIDGALLFCFIDEVESIWFTSSQFQKVYWLDGILTGAVVGLGIQIVHESHRGIRKTVAAIRKRHTELFSLQVQHAALERENVPPVPARPPDRLISAVYQIWWINLGIQVAAMCIVVCGLSAMGVESMRARGFLQSLNLYALPPDPSLLNLECYAFWFLLVTDGIVAATALISAPLTTIFERPLRNRIRAMDEEIDALRRSLSQRAGLGPEQETGSVVSLIEQRQPGR
jgi:hypothetical protein